jgi:hypothetical protein
MSKDMTKKDFEWNNIIDTVAPKGYKRPTYSKGSCQLIIFLAQGEATVAAM